MQKIFHNFSSIIKRRAKVGFKNRKENHYGALLWRKTLFDRLAQLRAMARWRIRREEDSFVTAVVVDLKTSLKVFTFTDRSRYKTRPRKLYLTDYLGVKICWESWNNRKVARWKLDYLPPNHPNHLLRKPFGWSVLAESSKLLLKDTVKPSEQYQILYWFSTRKVCEFRLPCFIVSSLYSSFRSTNALCMVGIMSLLMFEPNFNKLERKNPL